MLRGTGLTSLQRYVICEVMTTIQHSIPDVRIGIKIHCRLAIVLRSPAYKRQYHCLRFDTPCPAIQYVYLCSIIARYSLPALGFDTNTRELTPTRPGGLHWYRESLCRLCARHVAADLEAASYGRAHTRTLRKEGATSSTLSKREFLMSARASNVVRHAHYFTDFSCRTQSDQYPHPLTCEVEAIAASGINKFIKAGVSSAYKQGESSHVE